MRYLPLTILLCPSVALAQPAQPAECKDPSVCVPPEDVQDMVKALQEKQCLQTTQPKFELDRIDIVTDKDGRVFYSGAQPRPYTLKMTWCSYEATATGKVEVYAAKAVPEVWGFRFRPKAYIGALPLEAAYPLPEDESLTVTDLVDAGVMVDFFHYDWANINAAVGFRSVGGGLGADLTENFGIYTGYALTWGTWHHNLNVGLWFSFWNPD